MLQNSERMVLCVATGLDVYHMTLLRGMLEVFSRRGIPLLAYANYLGSSADATVDRGCIIPPSLACLVAHHRPRGVILMNSLSAEQHLALTEMLQSSGIPTVYLAQDVPGQVCVRADNVQGMRALMAHLLDECGVRVPAMIRGYAHQIDHVVRERVFREEIERRGLTASEDLFADGQAEREVARNGMRSMIEHRRDLDAVVTTDDWCAIAAVEALVEAGLRVPEDVVVTGFDNYPIASLNWPGITTVDQDLEGQGVVAAQALLDLIDGTPTRSEILTACRLVVRGSTLNPAIRITATDSSPDRSDSTTAETIARLAQSHVAGHNAIRRTSRALSDCRSVGAVRDALGSCLCLLGIRRCFLVIYQDQPAPQNEDCLHRVSRLVVDYRDGHLRPVSEATFSSCALLPDHLRGELREGFLGLQLLSVTSGVLGYLLTEHPIGHVSVAESLARDLGRSLEIIFSTHQLQAHSSMLEELVKRRTAELEAEVAIRRRTEHELQRFLRTDELTKIANRRAFQAYYQQQWRLHMEEGAQLALLMIDVDMFKPYNDHYGHLKGDEALCTVAACLQRSARYPEDLVSRIGGEEFTLLLPRSGQLGALTVAHRARELLVSSAIPHAASPIAPIVTMSIGIAVATPALPTSSDGLLAAADRALYWAKEQGRNCVALASVAVPTVSGSGQGESGPSCAIVE